MRILSYELYPLNVRLYNNSALVLEGDVFDVEYFTIIIVHFVSNCFEIFVGELLGSLIHVER